MKNGNRTRTRTLVNVAAINRSLHRHGESVGHGRLVDRKVPAYFDGNVLHMLETDETAAINRSLALHGECVDGSCNDDHAYFEPDAAEVLVDIRPAHDDTAAMNRSLALYDESI